MHFSRTAEGLSTQYTVGGWCVHRDVNSGRAWWRARFGSSVEKQIGLRLSRSWHCDITTGILLDVSRMSSYC